MHETCKTCGKPIVEPGHLCNPCGPAVKCNFCGASSVDARHMCSGKLAGMKFVCAECGRVAASPDLLCKPEPIINHPTAF